MFTYTLHPMLYMQEIRLYYHIAKFLWVEPCSLVSLLTLHSLLLLSNDGRLLMDLFFFLLFLFFTAGILTHYFPLWPKNFPQQRMSHLHCLVNFLPKMSRYIPL